MPKRVRFAREDLKHHWFVTGRQSAWKRGILEYAKEMFNELCEWRGVKSENDMLDEVTKDELLNGAENWTEYSYGGCALADDCEICERLCSPSIIKRRRGGALQPGRGKTWLDKQARALRIASEIVLYAVNFHPYRGNHWRSVK